jgi:tetratricopeptide (TPR) repeat protein
MNYLLRSAIVPSLLLVAAAGLAVFIVKRGSARVSAATASDQPLAAFRSDLVELAFRSASALPAKPHLRTRCRLQDDVVQTCLRLDVPRKALGYVEQIQDWRRGLGYADFAYYAASHGATEEIPHYLELAQKISEMGEEMITQDWQKERIRVAIAKTHAWLGHAKESVEFEAGIERAEMGKVDAVRALRGDPGAFDAMIDSLKVVLATRDLDLSRNALATGAQLFDRFYDDPARRLRAEGLIDSASDKLPVEVRFDHLTELAGIALQHKDPPTALKLVDEAQVLLDGVTWLPENYIPLASRLAALRFRSGAEKEGRAALDAALALYDEKRALIVDIYRGGALRPLAEAYEAMHDHAQALALYKRALDESVVNPNARPRVEDLVATCLSLAQNGVQPDAELSAKLEKVRAGLGAPW